MSEADRVRITARVVDLVSGEALADAKVDGPLEHIFVLQDEVVRIWMQTRKTILFITHDIGEAILLGDRIGVMRRGPGSNIREIIPVTLPRPRSRATLEFGQLYERINRLIMEEVKLGREAVHVGSQ